ncbi:heme-binding domain-containing protein [Vibrio chagasii]|nr:heme-binding domain-containing protein [Vibrio chagasii]
MPFYSEWPIAKPLMNADIQTGMKHFEIITFNGIQNNEPVSSSTCAY